MDKQHSEEFRTLIQSVLSGYAMEKVILQRNVLGWWWDTLREYGFDSVKQALNIHSQRSKFPPRPADIIEIINLNDGRPSPDEAWPIAIRAADENDTITWTDEISQAWFHCKPIYDAGDEVGARMSFRQYYQHLIDNNRSICIKVKWSMTIGYDKEKRDIEVEKAASSGLIGSDYANHLISHKSEVTEDGKEITALLGNDKKQPSGKTEFSRRLRKALDDANEISRQKIEREREEMIARKESENARRKELDRQAGLID